MIRKTLLILIQIFTLCAVYPETLNQPYSFKSDVNEGISQLSVMNIFQDSNGYLWFATKNGLNKFNGKDYVIYRREDGNDESLSNNTINVITEDSEGFLWVGTSSGLNRIDLHTDKIKQYPTGETKSLSEGIITIYRDRSDRLWVGTWTGLNVYNKEKDCFEPVTLDGELGHKTIITSLLEDSTGKFWIGTMTQGVYVCDNQINIISHLQKESKNMALNDNRISSILEDEKKQIWVGFKFAGLCRVDLRNNEIVSFTDKNSQLSDKNVRCLIEWNNQLLIGTFDGIFSLDYETEQIRKVAGYEHINQSLSHYSVYSFCVDQDSTLWVGTYAGGVNYLNSSTNRFVLHKPGERFNIRTGIYGAITYESPSRLWIATEGYGLLSYDYKTDESQYYLIDSSERSAFNTNIIKSVFYEEGFVWCGTTKGEIYKFDIKNRKFTLFYKYPVEQSVYQIARDSDGRLWAVGSTTEISLTCFDKEQVITSFTDREGETVYLSSLRCFFELDKNVFLLGTNSEGLLCLDITNKKTSSLLECSDE